MHAEYNASRAIAILVTTALLLNAMTPTLAHAATYLQGTEVNANTLVQNAYVAVTYYDSKGKQKLEKGWIDAVGETSFTIRSGGIKDKKTISYDKVVSVFISEETNTLKQMNEVNRFIRNIGQSQENARQAIQLLHGENVKVRFKVPSVSKGWVISRLIKMTQDTLVIEGPLRPFTPRRRPGLRPRPVKVTFDTLVIQGERTFYQIPYSSISNLEVSTGQYRNTGKGFKIGLGLGLAILVPVALIDLGGSGRYRGYGTYMISIFTLSLCALSTLIGTAIESDKWIEVPPQRLNLSVAPTSTKGLRTALTFNF